MEDGERKIGCESDREHSESAVNNQSSDTSNHPCIEAQRQQRGRKGERGSERQREIVNNSEKETVQ